MLEASLQKDNAFVTLTYKDEYLPLTEAGLPTLDRPTFTLWLKRVRKEIAPLRIRFYGVGEYSPAGRPHYHVIFFGLPPCSRGQTMIDHKGFPVAQRCCETCNLIHRTWVKYDPNPDPDGARLRESLGLVYTGTVTPESAAYTAGYLEKKMISRTDKWLNGRAPEFGAKSGGLGRDMMWDVASVLLTHNREHDDDVPAALRHGKKIMPLGRYLRGKLREAMGRDAKAPQATLDKMAEEMRPLRETAFNNSRSFKEEVIKANDQAVLNMEKRLQIFKSKKDKLK